MFSEKYLYYLFSIYKLLTGVKNWPLVVRVFFKIAPSSPHRIELRKSGLQLTARSFMDIWSIKETFLDRFYERFGIRIEDGWTIVDIGGGIGDYSLFAAYANPHGKVFAFEPFPESFALLKENLANNHIDNVQAFAEAIWSQSGVLKLDKHAGRSGQVHQPKRRSRRSEVYPGAVHYPGRCFAQLKIVRCDLMKIDCEGAEYAILFNTPDDVLGRIERIVMEYHDCITSDTHRDMRAFLSFKGFSVCIRQNYVHPDLGYLYAWRRSE